MKTILAPTLIAALSLAACDKMTNTATKDRLAGLQDGALPADTQADLDRALSVSLRRAESYAAIGTDFGGSLTDEGGAVPLQTLLQSALDHNPDIGRAAQAISAADAKKMNAVFGYLPQISATVIGSRLDQQVLSSDNEVFELGRAKYDVTNRSIQLRQPIIDISRMYGIQLAGVVRTRAEAEYIATVQEVMFSTFDLYLSAAQSKSRIVSLTNRAGLLSQQAGGADVLAQTGLDDAQTARAMLAEGARIQSQRAVEEARYAEALANLSALTGVPVTEVQMASLPKGVAGEENRTSAEAAIAAANAKNPTILAVAVGVIEADLSNSQAIARDFTPVLNAFASIDDEKRGGSRFGGGSHSLDKTYGLELVIPIFNADGNGYATIETSVIMRQAVLEYHSRKRQIEADIIGTLNRMRSLSKASAQLSVAVDTAGQNVETERAKLASGESTDVQLVSRELLAAELKEELGFQRLEYLRAWSRLQYLTGAISKVRG